MRTHKIRVLFEACINAILGLEDRIMIWKILGIEETKDEEMIRAAYRSKLRFVNPEDDEEGFKELRRAYEKALDYANQEEINDLHNIDNERPISVGRKTEVDLWIDRIDVIYQDVRSRRDEKKWNEILYDSVWLPKKCCLRLLVSKTQMHARARFWKIQK